MRDKTPNFSAYVPKRGPIKVLENGIGGKILGGSDAEKGEFPFQISWQSITGANVISQCMYSRKKLVLCKLLIFRHE